MSVSLIDLYAVEAARFRTVSRVEYEQFITAHRSSNGITIGDSLLRSFIKQNDLDNVNNESIRYLTIPRSEYRNLDYALSYKGDMFGIEILKNKKINVNKRRIIVTISNDECYELTNNALGNKTGAVITVFVDNFLVSESPTNQLGNKALEYYFTKYSELSNDSIVRLSNRTIEGVSRLHNNLAWRKHPGVDGDTLELFNCED